MGYGDGWAGGKELNKVPRWADRDANGQGLYHRIELEWLEGHN